MVRTAFVVFAIAVSAPAFGQSRTSCQQFGNRVDCNTTPDTSAETAQAAGNLGAVIGRALAKRRKPEPAPIMDAPVRAPASVMDLSTGNSFLSACTTQDTGAFWMCHGYLQGFLTREHLEGDNRLVCLPPTSTNGQIMDTVVAFIRDNPSDRHRPSGQLTAVALAQAFPCPAKK